ncbi:MAG: hypothetical protein QOJ51_6805 [Acidobacteriaceae bacterium]|nr:hypothetical protein [Acidobacteriaceae bacterium]
MAKSSPSTRSSYTRRSCKVRTQDLDAQLGEGATELRHALSALSLWLVDAEH